MKRDPETPNMSYADAREELRRCAELLQALAAVDLSRDLTKDAMRLARTCLGEAAKGYVAAVNAIHGTEEERRLAQAARIADGPMAPIKGRSDEDSAA